MKSALAMLFAFLGLVVALPAVHAQSPAQANVAGKWHFVFDTQDGNRVFDPVFQQEGDKVTGKWGESDVQGTFVNGALNLEFPTDSEVGKGTLTVKGKLANDQITGTWSFQSYDGTFKATRS